MNGVSIACEAKNSRRRAGLPFIGGLFCGILVGFLVKLPNRFRLVGTGGVPNRIDTITGRTWHVRPTGAKEIFFDTHELSTDRTRLPLGNATTEQNPRFFPAE